jgi:hypothetical protein
MEKNSDVASQKSGPAKSAGLSPEVMFAKLLNGVRDCAIYMIDPADTLFPGTPEPSGLRATVRMKSLASIFQNSIVPKIERQEYRSLPRGRV